VAAPFDDSGSDCRVRGARGSASMSLRRSALAISAAAQPDGKLRSGRSSTEWLSSVKQTWVQRKSQLQILTAH